MLFEGRYKTQDYFRYFLHLFPVPSFICSKNEMGLILAYPSKDSLNYLLSLFPKDGFACGHSIQYNMFLVRFHVHVYRSI